MEALIKALTIFLKYNNPHYPFQCEHDILYINGIVPSDVSDEDKLALEELGFHVSEENDNFYSFEYGSC